MTWTPSEGPRHHKRDQKKLFRRRGAVPLAASSALSAVSVALQGFYDVERVPGLKEPCFLYMLSIAESGERKTSCDGYFKQALEAWQREQAEFLKPAIAAYEADKASWGAKKSGILKAVKKAAKEDKPTAEHDLLCAIWSRKSLYR